MTLLFVDGFDHYETADLARKWTSSSNASIAAGAARYGAGGLRLSSAAFGAYVSRGFGARASWIVGCAFKVNSFATETVVIGLRDAGSYQVQLRIQTNGLLRLVRGNDSATLATGSTALSSGSWYYLELKATINDATGSYTVRINGATEFSGSSADTQATGTATADEVVLGYAGAGAGVSANHDYDDVYVADTTGPPNNDVLGDCRVETLYPSGAGAAAAWTPNGAGSNYDCVDEAAPDDDTTYVSSSTATQKDTYAAGDLSGTPDSIKGVQTVLMVRKDDAGTRTFAAVIRSGGADYDGTSVNVTTDYLCYPEVRETDPATSAAWTASGVNALEVGVKLVA